MTIDWQQLNELDFSNMGQWPRFAQVGLIAVLCTGLFVGSYFLLIQGQLEQLAQLQKQEQVLKDKFTVKAKYANDLPSYQARMNKMLDMFSSLLKRLPTHHEIASLLDDMTYLGTVHGLEFKSIAWQPEINQEFYIELPMTMQVQGSYHQFGEFVSELAKLPRIILVKDFSIETTKDNQLTMNLVATTYRYNDKERAK